MTTYYVSASGSDSNTGTDINLPIATITKVNTLSLVGGDNVLFKCGDMWLNQGHISTRNGSVSNPITFSSYGTGAKPILKEHGDLPDWNIAENWTQDGASWYMASPWNPNRLWINGVEALRSQALPTTTNNKYYATASRIYIYSATNPALTFSSITATLNYYIFLATASNYITISGLDLQGTLNSVIRMVGCNHWIIENCNIGAYSSGNGISGNAYDATNLCDNNTVRNCTFDTKLSGTWGWEAGYSDDGVLLSYGCNNWDIHDNSFKNWGHASYGVLNLATSYTTGNNKFYKNYCTAPDIDYGRAWGYSSTSDVGNEIYHNVFYNMGVMSQTNGPNLRVYYNIFNRVKEPAYRLTTGQGLNFDGYSGGVPQNNEIYNNIFAYCGSAGILMGLAGDASNARSGNKIINNIIYECDNTYSRAIRISDSPNNLNNTFKNNLLYKSGVTGIVSYKSLGTYTATEFNALNGTDGNIISNNIQGDPLFIDPLNGDFRLKANSPANNAGILVGLTTDYYGNSISGNPDIGIFESFNPTGAKRVLKAPGGKYYRNLVTGKFYVR